MHLPVVGLLKCLTKRHNSKGGWVDAEDTFHLLEVEHASMWGLFMVMSHSDMSCKMSHCNVSKSPGLRSLYCFDIIYGHIDLLLTAGRLPDILIPMQHIFSM